MKYKLIQGLTKDFKLLSQEEILKEILEKRGVLDVEAFLKANENDVYDGRLLKNMDKAIECFVEHMSKGSRVHVVVDCDTDGCSSAGILVQYIRRVFPDIKVTYGMNEGKKHGVFIDELPPAEEFDLLVLPDCGSNDKIACDKLKDLGKDIIVLDHHLMEVENPSAIVVNCHDGQYPNPTLTGSAMVYKFCKELDKEYHIDVADDYIDLCALGLVGDMADVIEEETRFLIKKGSENIKNDFIQEILLKRKIIEKKEDKVGIIPSIFGMKVAPVCNGVVRCGNYEQRLDMMRALFGEQEDRIYQPRRKSKNDPKPEPIVESLQVNVLRMCDSVKSKQTKEVGKIVKEIVNEIESQELYKDKVIILDLSKLEMEVNPVYTGLLASKVANQYKKPVLICNSDNEENFRGSGRGYNLSGIESLKQEVEATGLAKGMGHDNAFGISFKKENIDNLRESLNKRLDYVSNEDVWLVDYETPFNYLKLKDVKRIGELNDIFCTNLTKPKFAITGIQLEIGDIALVGKNENVLRITKEINGQVFKMIKLNSSIEEYCNITGKTVNGIGNKSPKGKVILEIIAEFDINVFNGVATPQINILDFNVKKESKTRLRF